MSRVEWRSKRQRRLAAYFLPPRGNIRRKAAREQARKKGILRLAEISSVLLHFDHLASVIVNADHSVM